MDSDDEESLNFEMTGHLQASAIHAGPDLDHIAAVLADPHPSSGKLQGRKLAKRVKRRVQVTPPFSASSSEVGPSGRHTSSGALGTSADRIPHALKGKEKQQIQQGASAAQPSSTQSRQHLLVNTSKRRLRRRSRTEKTGHLFSEADPNTPNQAQAGRDSAGHWDGRQHPPQNEESAAASSSGRGQPHVAGMHPIYDRPGQQATPEASFCEACACWVPEVPSGRAEMWRRHAAATRHRREVSARLREEAASESTRYYRSNVLPAMKHAAEELRCLGVGGSGGGGGPSLRQAAKSANEVLCAGNSTSRQISRLHADAMKELVHHTGGAADFHRLATRLSRERLACAWPAAAAKVEARADNDTLMMLAATPATIACLAALLPRVATSTVVVSLASMHALDMAPTTAALCLLARELAAGNAVRRLNLSLLGMRAESTLAVPAGHAAESQARLIGRVIQELKRTVAVNTSLRLVLLRVMEPKLVAREWAEVQAAAATAAPRQRAAVAAALHPRVSSASCPLRWLPLAIFKEILDLAVPVQPCKVVLR